MDNETRDEFQRLHSKLQSQAATLDAHGAMLDAHGATLEAHGAKLDEHSVKFDHVIARLDNLETRLDTLADEVARDIKGFLGVMFEQQKGELRGLWEKISHQDSKIEAHDERIERLESRKSA